jgi:hypothetical protein
MPIEHQHIVVLHFGKTVQRSHAVLEIIEDGNFHERLRDFRQSGDAGCITGL